MQGVGVVATQPRFRARMIANGVEVEGESDVFLGHRIKDGARPQGGNWVEWHWKGDGLTVANDIHGAYPVYYAVSDTSIAISPSIDALLEMGVPRALDEDALAAFLTVGYYLETDTPFRAIRSLPPACRLSWRAGVLSLESSPPRFTMTEMTRSQAAEGITELMRQAVARRIPAGKPAFIMPVSGGRDSRHILLELLRQGHPPNLCVTTDHYPYDWGGDVPYGAQLADALEIPHAALGPGPPVAAELRKNRLTSYGSVMHAWFLPVVDALVDKTEHTYEGLPGGTILERRFITRRVRELSRARRWDELAAWMGKKEEGQARYLALLAPQSRSRLSAERATERIRRGLEPQLDADDPFMSYRFWNRTLRELTLTPNAMLSGVPTVYTPYMDPDLLAFGMSIPGRHIDRAFHDEILASAYPEVADVPFAPKRRPEPGRSFLRRLDRELLRLLWRHSDGSLVDRAGLMRRASSGVVRGDGWFAWGRRFSLVSYLVQLEGIVSGSHQPGAE